MKRILFFLFLTSFIAEAHAQTYTRYVIRFTDKIGTPYSISNPSQFLSARSIARRQRENIAIDEDDLPVTPRYIDSVRLSGAVTILNVSKWLNQVCIYTTDNTALAKINSLPFVIATQPVRRPVVQGVPNNKFIVPVNNNSISLLRPQANAFDYGSSFGQIHIHQGEFLHNLGFAGQGMLIAMLDAGFLNYRTNPLLDSLNIKNQVLDTYNYVDPTIDVNQGYFHGANCLSIIAANDPGQIVGSCPEANFLLYETEDVSSESPLEEQNWVAAAEHADSIGADVISTSLGYTTFDNPALNHTYADMNGRITIIARGNTMAARKGMLSLVAAGNDGNDSWHYIGTPADADSILAVGAVDVAGSSATFSSYGPSSDGRIKPDIASVGLGTFYANPSGVVASGNGTSYATPNFAGLATCLWQAFPELTNMDIINAVKQSGSIYNAPDTRRGYGIPDVKKAFVLLSRKLFTQFSSNTNCTAKLQWSAKAGENMSFTIERKTPSQTTFTVVGNSSTPAAFTLSNYTFSDDLRELEQGNISYRLKQTIGTDTAFYLDTLLINNPVSCVKDTTINTTSVIIEPNPVGSSVIAKISLTTGGTVNLIIYNAIGQKIYASKNTQQSSGSTLYHIPFAGESKGVYYLKVMLNNSQLSMIRFLK